MIMKELNLEENCWSTCVKDYLMHGTYRRMLLTPSNLEGVIENNTLKLSFSLGNLIHYDTDVLDSGCYATMLIREITKYETDGKSQLALLCFVCFCHSFFNFVFCAK